MNKKQRVVVKIGTSSLVNTTGAIKMTVIHELATVMSALNHQAYEMVLVTSGAVGVGMNQIGLSKRPTDIAELQALSAIGQSELMELYAQAFRHFKQPIAQLLLTRDVVDYPKSHHNVLRTVNKLLEHGVIPIINENDAVSVDEFNHQTTFGENDQLAAIVTNFIDANLLIILSDIDGLYDVNPRTHPDAHLLSWVSKVDDQLMTAAGEHGSQYGTGGMRTKLKAAALVLSHQKEMVILNGQHPQIIKRLLNGDRVGTRFSIDQPEG